MVEKNFFLPGNKPTVPSGPLPCHQSFETNKISVIIAPSGNEISFSSIAV
jgi:hypothetical protein